MNKGITYKAIKHRKLTIFMILVTLIAGIYSYVMLPRQESPDISVPGAQIIVIYPGASPADMETYVTDVIEDELREVEGYDTSESVSKSNITSIMLFLKDNADTDVAWDDLDDVMAEVENDLPDGVTEVIVNTEVMETPGMIIGITGENYTNEELADYADYFKDKLAKINGVSRFDVYGDIDKEIEVVLDHELIDQYGLTVQQVISLLKAENITMPTGAIDNGSSKIEVNLDAEFSRVEDIENTVILNLGDGRQVKLKDVGTVNYQNNPDDSRFSKNGDKAVYLAGFFEESLNVVRVGEEVEAEINRLKINIPNDIDFFFMVYHPHEVEKSINDFMVNLVQAVFFVVVVVFIGMGWRNAVVVSTVIPLSICITMTAMYFMGVKLEQMSIAGLIIALGMLVDNAIVVSDAIQHHIDEGIENFKAAVMGTKEVGFSILTSTLTTIFAFMPLLLLDSSIGQFVYGVPYVVTVAIIASYICALITTPVIAGMTFSKAKDHKEKKDSRLRKLFLTLLERGLSRKKTTIVLSIIFVIFSSFFIKGLEMTLLPKADKVMLQIDLTCEVSSDIDKTEELSDQTIDLLKDIPELKNYYVSIGSNLPKFYLSVMYRADSPDIAQIAYTFDISESDQFKSKESLQEYIQTTLNNELIGGTASTLLLELGSFGRPIEFEVTGDDLDRLDEVRYELISMMQSKDSILNIDDDFSSKEYQFYIDIDETKASYYGFTKYDMQSEVTAALMGMEASTFKKNGDEISIIATSDIKSIQELENLGIKSNMGQQVLLKDLAQVEMVTNFPVINHSDGERSMTITSDVGPSYSNIEVEQEIKDFAQAGDYDDLEFDFDGMMATMMESNMAILQLGVIALFLILAVLILQFDSYRQPLVVLAIIPLAFASALLGLFLSGQNLSFVAMLSLLALMGIVVNNAIVLLDCINVLLSEGMPMEEACIAAVNRRYRPITLSTTTTVIGLIPLLISGGELFRPLAVTLMSGLGLSMVLTMVIIPTVYSLLMSKKENKARKIQLKSNV